jgi:hypothetical protein
MSRDLVKEAKEAVNSFAVVLANFLQIVNYDNLVICVFEGKDHSYYGPRIDAYIPPGKIRYNFAANGKRNVLKLIALRNSNANITDANSVFFVDRDFDLDLEIIPRILYVTPSYSIENFYICFGALRRIISDLMGLPIVISTGQGLESNPEIENVVTIYESRMNELNSRLLLPLNAFILAAIEREREAPGQELGLDKFRVGGLMDISISHLHLKMEPSFENIKSLFPKCTGVTIERFDAAFARLRERDLMTTGRGKFLLEAGGRLIKELFDDAQKSRPRYFKKKLTVNASYNKETILHDLSRSADTPLCLKEFLSRYFFNQ